MLPSPSFFFRVSRENFDSRLRCSGFRGIDEPVGTIALFFLCGDGLPFFDFNLTFVVTSLLETYAAAERIFKIEDSMPETEEPEQPVACGEIENIEFRM